MGKKYILLLHFLVSLIMSTSLMAQSYCVPSFGVGCSWDDYLDDFIIKDDNGGLILNHLNSGCSSNGYGNFTNNSSFKIEVNGGEEYNFEVTHGYYDQMVQIWVDLDGNGSFEDSGEMLFKSATNSGEPYTPTKGKILIPSVVGNVITRMRVKTYSAGNPNDMSNSCTQLDSYGEVHDYTIVIAGEPLNCMSPKGLKLDSATALGVEFSWNNSVTSINGYTWYVMDNGRDPDVDTPIESGTLVAGTESLSITTLDSNVLYDFYLRGECDNAENTKWEKLTFYILADGATCEMPLEITALPFTHSDNTKDYLNLYSGTPGASCGTAQDYLNGYEVVYEYTADIDDLVTFKLTDLQEYYAGIFIYESCADIGNSCAAASVAGPSMEDVVIIDFPVEQGKTYYVVVSSWFTDTISYTLDIKKFDCSELEAPMGEALQGFTAGDTMAHLEATATRPSGVLSWYTDAALTNKITDLSTHALTAATSYYVTQTVRGCESPTLKIETEYFDCNLLEIYNITEGEVACRGSVTLKATASGNGGEIFWYDEEVGGNVLTRGGTYVTPEIAKTTSYWVSEVYGENLEPIRGLGKREPNSYNLANPLANTGLTIEAFEAFTIVDVEVFSTDVGGDIEMVLQNAQNNIIARKTVTIPDGSSGEPTPYTIELDFNVPGPGTYYLKNRTGKVRLVYQTSSREEFPYTLGTSGLITFGTTNNFNLNTYYFFYNWTIVAGDVICESPRQEVIASVDQSGDINIDYTSLPYINTNKTSLYGNDYSGNVGEGCVGEGYLNGFETMYHYVAHPTKEDILQIELIDFDSSDAAIFIYDSCGNIGIECLAGVTVVDGKLKLEDYYVAAGEELIILISSATGMVNYTLEITGVDCANVDMPDTDSAPFFATGQTISDLNVGGSVFNEGFVWYKDAALTDIIADPSTELLMDEVSIYVTQTILGCESSGIEVTPIEFDCSLMNIDVLNPINYVCAPSGTVILEAQSTGLGSEVFWYDAETQGNIVGRGERIEVSVGKERTFWVTEVFTNQSGASNEPLNPACKPAFAVGCKGNDYIDDFILKDNNGTELIAHLSTGCSTDNGYADYTKSNVYTTELIAGSTYDFETTFGAMGQYLRIWIDFDGDGSFDNDTELVFSSNTAGSTTSPTIDKFKLPNHIVSRNAVLRLMTTYSKGYGNSCGSSGSYGEVHDYKVTLVGASVICESPRQEVTVLMNTLIPDAPLVTPMQIICEGGLLSEITVLGKNIRWYNVKGNELKINTRIIEGETYYVTQTINACESEMTEVIMDFNDRSEFPTAAVNQAFEVGQTLADLEVYGENLKWYTDQWKSREIPETTELVTQTTYYVSQERDGECEGEALGITVHRKLDVEEVLFEHFEFYPNPVEEVLLITNAHTIEKIEIFDLTGKKVFVRTYQNQSIELDVTGLSSGTYLLKAKVDATEKIFRIIKK